MDNLTPYFPQLRAQCAPLGIQLQRTKVATESIAGLAALFTSCFGGLLVPAKKGPGSRHRELPRVAVFWAFPGAGATAGRQLPLGLDPAAGRRRRQGPPADG